MISNFLHWQIIIGLLFHCELRCSCRRFPFLLWATRAATPHVTQLTERWSPKREAKAVRNEQLEVCRVWDDGRRIPQSGSLTKQTPSHIAALSPVPTAIAAPCSCRLRSPGGAGHRSCCALTGGAGMVIFWKKFFFRSIHGCAYAAKSTPLALSKGRSSPQFNKYNETI